MSAETESPNTPKKTSARPHRPRQKSKPKFEIPVEAARPEASAAWVHRSETETPPAETKKHEHIAAAAKPAAIKVTASIPTEPAAEANPTFVRLGVALFAAGATVIGQLSLAAIDMMTMPIRWGRGLVSSK